MDKPTKKADTDLRPEGADVDQLAQLVDLTYHELRRLAARFLDAEGPGHTLQPTALVHEVYLRLRNQRNTTWENKSHFLAIAAKSMRRILVDHARTKMRDKRGGRDRPISVEGLSVISNEHSFGLVALDDSLTRLSKIDARQASIVELRFFGGASIDQAAEILNISPATVKRDWNFAKAWLYGDLKLEYGIDPSGVGRD